MSVVNNHTLKYSEGDTMMNQEMDSNIGHLQQHCHQHNSGLMRYRSGQSSLLKSLMNNNNNNNNIGCVNDEAFASERRHHHHHHHQQPYAPSTSSEMETMLAKLVSSNTNSEPLQEFGVKQEAGDSVSQQHNCYSYGPSAQITYQPQQVQGFSMPNGNAFDGSFSVMSSTQSKMGTSSTNCSNHIRQKSSPAEFFSNFSVDNALREVGSLNFSSRQSSCSSRMPQFAENGNEGMESNFVENRNMGNDNGSTKCYMSSFPSDFWDGSTFNAPKMARNNGEIMFSTSNVLDTRSVDFGYQKVGLTHHLSLPSSSSKMATMEKLFQIQGSVPCKIRAKRGFATHPRSIAERERRTRISARIKKLQDLFPKSDKQTSTADMLDFAVEYIKDLQKQVKILTDTKAKCTCTKN